MVEMVDLTFDDDDETRALSGAGASRSAPTTTSTRRAAGTRLPAGDGSTGGSTGGSRAARTAEEVIVLSDDSDGGIPIVDVKTKKRARPASDSAGAPDEMQMVAPARKLRDKPKPKGKASGEGQHARDALPAWTGLRGERRLVAEFRALLQVRARHSAATPAR